MKKHGFLAEMNLEIYLHQMTILNDGSHYWYKALQVDQVKALGTLFRKGIKSIYRGYKLVRIKLK